MFSYRRSEMRRLLVGLTLVCSTLPVMADGLPQRQQRIGEPYAPAAQGAVNWSGPYVGGGVGVFAGLTGLEEKGANVFDVGNWGYLGDVRVGYNHQFPGGILVLGPFAGYSFGEAEADIAGIPARLKPTWNVGARLGVAVGNSLIYTGYKYSQAEIDVGGIGDTIEGHTILGGIELMAFRPVNLQM